MTKLKPQAQKALDHMREHGSISDLEALHALGIRRLAARVWEIRRELGEDRVGTEWETAANGSRYARYVWHEPEQLDLLSGAA